MTAAHLPDRIHILCETCGGAIPAQDINLQLNVAKCDPCDLVFPIQLQVVLATRPSVDRPRTIKVHEVPGEIRLVRKWYSSVAISLLLGSAFWNGIVSIFVTHAVLSLIQGSPVDPFTTVFLMPFVAIGLGSAYFTLALFLNRSTVIANDTLLASTHGPLPFGRRRREFVAAEVRQLYVKKSGWQVNDRDVYEVRVQSGPDDDRRLLANLHEYETARFVEQAIEDFLGIPDAPVPGEASS